MKTLKKTLCLVLAMVMVFGLCVTSASAKLGYGDTDDITYKEAVDVLSGIGILSGDARGFRPKDDITRAEAAKIMAYIMIGNATQADALKATSDPFIDVPASHWASGYIAYCNSVGVILGMSDGYHPNENVTGLQFATMLLRALGYGKQGEYVGSDWSIFASKDAIRLGIFDDNIAGANINKATREECALYAFNTIARVRDGQTGLKKVSYSSLAGDYVANGAFGSGSNVDANKKGTFAADFGLSAVGAGEDDFERPAGHKWVQKLNGVTKTITAEYPDNSVEMTLFTTKVTGADMYNLFGSDAKDLTIKSAALGSGEKDTATLHVYVDGVEKYKTTDEVVDPATKFVKGDDTNIVGSDTGNGVETYVYSWYDADENLNVKICIINTWLAKVDKVVAAKSNADAETTVTTLTATGAPGKKTYKTEEDLGFEKDDYVLITYAGGAIQSMEAAPVVEGTISRFIQDGTKKSFVSGGTTYVAAKNAASGGDLQNASTDIGKGVVDGKDHKLYIDNHGYLIAVADVKTESNYVYVSHFDKKTDVSGNFDNTSLGAKVYFADGTNDIVTIGKINGTKVTGNDLSTYKANVGLYKLTWDGSKANLDRVNTNDKGTNGETVVAAATGKVQKGIASSIGGSLTATNKTVFFYVKNAKDDNPTAEDNNWNESDFTVTVYTGINSVPANSDGNKALAKAALVKDDATTAEAVLVADLDKGDDKDTIYIYTGDYNVEEVGGKFVATYKTYVNGEQHDLEITFDKKSDVKDYSDSVNVFFKLKGTDEIVKSSEAKIGTGDEINKYKYQDAITVASARDKIGEYDYELPGIKSDKDGSAAAKKFAGTTTKVIDLTNNKIGEDYSDLYAFISDTDYTVSSLKVAIQYGDAGNYLYITECTRTAVGS